MDNPSLGPDYGRIDDAAFSPRYRAACHCGAVRYEVRADPVAAKLCHCRDCQRIHGAPMQWAAIFHKRDVRLTAGAEHLRFYNSRTGETSRTLPCKVACGRCGTLIADEGRRMWLAFPTLFEFGAAGTDGFPRSGDRTGGGRGPGGGRALVVLGRGRIAGHERHERHRRGALVARRRAHRR